MTDLKIFRVTGSYKIDRSNDQDFARDLACKDEKEAREKILSLIGSQHRIKRRDIKIEKIEKIPAAESNDPVAKGLAGG